METGLCAQTGRAHKALNLEAGYQLFTGLEDDVSIIIYIYIWKGVGVGGMGKKIQWCRPFKSRLV